MPLRPPPCCHRQKQRLFTTSSVQNKNAITKLQPKWAPAYPYPRAYWYKQANTGLYGGVRIQFGHNVVSRTVGSWKSRTVTPRRWSPNIKIKSLYSKALGRSLRLKVSTRVLRTIDKVGGLDEYVLGEKPARCKELGEAGWKLRWMVLQSKGLNERVAGDGRLRKMLEELGIEGDEAVDEKEEETKQETQQEKKQDTKQKTRRKKKQETKQEDVPQGQPQENEEDRSSNEFIEDAIAMNQIQKEKSTPRLREPRLGTNGDVEVEDQHMSEEPPSGLRARIWKAMKRPFGGS